MKVIFFGTSDYCLPVLESLNSHFDLKLVVTREDKPVGRKKILTPSGTKTWAIEHKIPVRSDLPAGKAGYSQIPESDLAIVADYGRIIPEQVFTKSKLGTFNIHFSKLPDLRGASPVQYTLLRGDKDAWITVFKIEKTLDTGPILWQKSFPIVPNDTTQTLYTRLFQKVAKTLPDQINQIGQIRLTPQLHTNATFCRYLTREDGFIGLEILQTAQNGKKIGLSDLPEIQQEALKSKMGNENYGDLDAAEHVLNFFHAVTPWPGMWTMKGEKRMKILKCHLERGKLILDEVQFEGKTPQILQTP